MNNPLFGMVCIAVGIAALVAIFISETKELKK